MLFNSLDNAQINEKAVVDEKVIQFVYCEFQWINLKLLLRKVMHESPTVFVHEDHNNVSKSFVAEHGALDTTDQLSECTRQN